MKTISHTSAPVALLNTTPAFDIYQRDIQGFRPISAAQEHLLALRIQQGDEDALRLLVQANLSFVLFVAKQYQRTTLQFADLVQAGNTGLVLAARNFNPTKGTRFTTYAVKVIQTEIINYIYQAEDRFHVPRTLFELNSRIEAFTREYIHQFDVTPNRSEVANGLNISEHDIQRAQAVNYHCNSIDDSVGNFEGENLTLGGTLTDEEASAEAALLMVEDHDVLFAAMQQHLDERHRLVLTAYYGLDGKPSKTYEEISHDIHSSIETVRQIRNRALGLLRHSLRVHQLREVC